MGKEGEKESAERKFPFYGFQSFIPPQKSGLMGLGEKTMSSELWLCICALLWCCPSRMTGPWWGHPQHCHLEPRVAEGGWLGNQGLGKERSRRSLVGMDLEHPYSWVPRVPTQAPAPPTSRALAATAWPVPVSSCPSKHKPQPPSQP